jgi:hypothetical protein
METTLSRLRWLALLPLSPLLAACSGNAPLEESGSLQQERAGERQESLSTTPVPIIIQAVIARNDNGTNSGTNISCTDVQNQIAGLNSIYASAKIVFEMNATRDCVVINSSMLNVDDVSGQGIPHQAVRDAVARKYPNKLVIIFRDGAGSFSARELNFVVFSNSTLTPMKLAHETGHYFGLPHTHPGSADGVTRDEAIATIRNAVNAGTVTLANGLNALSVYDDGIADTPIDLGARAYVGFLDGPARCTTDLPLPVTTNFGSQTYFHRPPYSNPMSYWDSDCPNEPWAFTAGQAAIIRKSLFEATKAHLRRGPLASRTWGELYNSPTAVSRNANEIVVYASSADGRVFSRAWRSATGYDPGWFSLQGSTLAGYGYTTQGFFQPFTMNRTTSEIDVFSYFMGGRAQSKVFLDSTGAYFPSNTEWFDQDVWTAATGPSAAARGAQAFMLTLRGSDGTVYARNFDNVYASWIGLGGKGETRSTVVARNATEFHAFARWNDGSVRHRGWTTAAGWDGSWEHLGASGEGSPSAVADSSGLDVFALWEDRTLRTKRLTTSWSPSQTTWTNLGSSSVGRLASQPFALLAGTSRVVIARYNDGSVRLIGGNASGVYGSWINAGGRTIGAPTAVALTSTQVVIYARWFDGSIRSRVRDLSAQTWWPATDWLDLGTPPNGSAVPAVDGCTAIDIASPSTSFCSTACPCDFGEGGCDSDNECQPGLRCAASVGPAFGLPTGYGVCYPKSSIYDPDNRSETFCTASDPCDIGEGDCDSSSECLPGLDCRFDHGTDYGAPSSWDFCDVAP